MTVHQTAPLAVDHSRPAVCPVSLDGLGIAVPEHILPQDMVKTAAKRILGPRYPEFDRLSQSFLTAGIEKRYSVAPFEWFEEPKDWPERTKAYLEGATALFCDAARSALNDARLEPHDIDQIVTVSSTGIATPTLEARAFKELGFRRDVQRVPVFGLGCAGGVSGLSVATRLARANPGSRVLMVAVETCTLSFRADRLRKADIIATVLFGDGAAAACLSAPEDPNAVSPGQVMIGEGFEYTWPDTLPIMGWDVDHDGFGVIFDRSIPGFLKENYQSALSAASACLGKTIHDIDRLVCHPGGAKVVEALEETLGFTAGSLDHERAVLSEFGNMSAPTVLFVLQKVLAEEAASEMLMTALGPGFTGSFLSLTRQPA
ncbi:MAG: type III polyketide synthase [Pseudomonadota bacterium]